MDVKKLKVYITGNDSNSIDITNQVLNIRMVESIEGDIYGQIDIEDSKQTLETAIGTQQTITVTYEYLSVEYINRFYLDGASNVDITSNTGKKTYVLNLTSYNEALNSSQLVSRSYKGTSTDIIRKVFAEFFGKGSFVYKAKAITQGNYIAPNISPKTVVDIIKQNAYDENLTPFFIFQRAIDKGVTTMTSFAEISRQNTSYRISPILPTADTVNNELAQVGMAERIIINSDHDHNVVRTASGVFGKTLNEVKLDSSEILTNKYGLANGSVTKTIPFIDNKYDDMSTPLLNSGDIKNREVATSIKQQMYSSSVTAYQCTPIPKLGVGDLLELVLKGNSPQDRGINPKHSGNYIVSEIIHRIMDGVYTQDITMVRN